MNSSNCKLNNYLFMYQILEYWSVKVCLRIKMSTLFAYIHPHFLQHFVLDAFCLNVVAWNSKLLHVTNFVLLLPHLEFISTLFLTYVCVSYCIFFTLAESSDSLI